MTGWKRFFRFAAVFNTLAGLALLLTPELFFSVLTIEGPVTTEALPWIHQFAALVLVFGGGYWVISLDPEAHADIVWMGCIGKLAVFAMAWVDAIIFRAPIEFALLVIADFLFAMGFAYFLIQFYRQGRTTPSNA